MRAVFQPERAGRVVPSGYLRRPGQGSRDKPDLHQPRPRATRSPGWRETPVPAGLVTPRTSGLTDMLSKRGIGWTPGVAALVAALALGGLAAGSALAQAGMRGSSSTAAGDDELGTEPGHWGSPRLQKQVDLWLDRVNATADQRTRIHGILDRARPELQTAARQWRRDLQQLRTALTGQSVDRKQADMARQDAARVFDRASITFTNALADMSQVLTPDQRNKLAQQLS